MSFPPRLTRPLGIHEVAGWRLKLYGVTVRDALPPQALISAALRRCEAVLPAGAGAGFVIVHEARPGCFVLINWWCEVDLHQRYFQSPLDDPAMLVDRVQPNAVGCVWELAVIGYEAAAWARHGGEIDAYLTDVLTVQTPA